MANPYHDERGRFSTGSGPGRLGGPAGDAVVRSSDTRADDPAVSTPVHFGAGDLTKLNLWARSPAVPEHVAREKLQKIEQLRKQAFEMSHAPHYVDALRYANNPAKRRELDRPIKTVKAEVKKAEREYQKLFRGLNRSDVGRRRGYH